MTEEVQWGEWCDVEGEGVCRLPLNDDLLVEPDWATASYLNALEREVRELREYKALADEARTLLEAVPSFDQLDEYESYAVTSLRVMQQSEDGVRFPYLVHIVGGWRDRYDALSASEPATEEGK